ncbi:hypothetical protein CH289_19145 [Rhodococcus sp. RS1C4]|uniref:hypothetical protein n=1 Tax=Nocardiaceae TaxID=85025 RepID=UPI000369FFC3|nr:MULTISPECIES: hypothetical protein [Rhodococcus]OZC45906.1 hypothetical protein CH267_28685 [Rhodococcus sp. 06-621-2]OZC48506.1 hypothetical protein CH289_19145 [Rhodococcus sp. RS1C4]OZD12682.1 hypothetical protein CH280_16860 [Rhodococcus sp. 06-156-4C]OZD24304.1 hypothetical protein CH253_06240 [Rhodococcus sp. 06-156-3C]OZD27414.1 hypothetical protein CH248_02585 [Rhodococcus sp. 06-156-4a]
MLPLLARKYLYRYLFVAIALPILARILVLGGLAIERRSGKPNLISKVLTKSGRFAERRAEKASGKHAA